MEGCMEGCSGDTEPLGVHARVFDVGLFDVGLFDVWMLDVWVFDVCMYSVYIATMCT